MLGDRIGPYEVVGLLGRGGMGEVYRARDDRLGRDVALKILPPEFAADAERLARFEREARLLASLQHQNIAAIYGLEELDGKPVLVMELAEGDELAVRLGGGALPPDEAERIAHQLAAGLEYAHERGIVHRDLKPANVKIGPDGRVKILDFGLARALEGSHAGSNLASAPDDGTITRTRELTGAGAVLGTAAYMSPEQTRGYAVDRRTDIWAFGVILWEMLAGHRLFAGETASDTLAAVLRQEPDWDTLPDGTPPVLVQLCRRCLERDPKLRLRDIGEARVALEGSTSSMMGLSPALRTPPESAGLTGSARLPWLVAAAATLALLAIGTLGFTGRLRPAATPERLTRTTVVLDKGQGLSLQAVAPAPPVLSPDGRILAFAMQDTNGQTGLAVRYLDEDAVRPIAGTSGAVYPFWGPQSRRVGFFADGFLKTVDVTGGGPVVSVCPAGNPKGGSWYADDRILFTPTHAAAIYVVAAAGGEPRAVTDPSRDDRFRSHRFPQWLPDGKHFLYLAWHAGSAQANAAIADLRVGSVDSTLDRELMPIQTQARYVAGQVLYLHENNLMARPFDAGSLAFTGPPRPILGGVLELAGAHCGVFSPSDAGVLSFVGMDAREGTAELVWADDQERKPVLGDLRTLLGIAISPDGTRVAVSRADEQLGSTDIWIQDLARGVDTRLTFATGDENAPVWSPDGRWIYYQFGDAGRYGIERKRVDGSGQPETVTEGDRDDYSMDAVSPDGRTVAYQKNEKDGSFHIWLVDVDGGEPHPFRDVPYSTFAACFSPDGRWLAYAALEAGQPQVYIEPIAPGGGRWRVSQQGGLLPTWSPQGDRLYYLEGKGNLMATEIDAAGNSLSIGPTTRIATGVITNDWRTVDVDPTSGRLLIAAPVNSQLNDRIEIVSGWPRLLARQDI